MVNVVSNSSVPKIFLNKSCSERTYFILANPICFKIVTGRFSQAETINYTRYSESTAVQTFHKRLGYPLPLLMVLEGLEVIWAMYMLV